MTSKKPFIKVTAEDRETLAPLIGSNQPLASWLSENLPSKNTLLKMLEIEVTGKCRRSIISRLLPKLQKHDRRTMYLEQIEKRGFKIS